MEHIEPILLALVVGHGVSPGIQGMIAAAILIDMIPNGRSKASEIGTATVSSWQRSQMNSLLNALPNVRELVILGINLLNYMTSELLLIWVRHDGRS